MRTLALLRRSAAPLALLAALSACADPTPLQPSGDDPEVRISANLPDGPDDPASILRAEIRGDRLLLEVRYGGGCREHRFALAGGGVFMESQPVQTSLRLEHDALGDVCRALVERELSFDLTPLREAYLSAYGQGGTLVIHLYEPGSGAVVRPPLRYDF